MTDCDREGGEMTDCDREGARKECRKEWGSGSGGGVTATRGKRLKG